MSSVEVISHNHTLLNSRKTFSESQTCHSSEVLKDKTVSEVISLIRDNMAFPVKHFDNLRSRSSDSGKSSSCSPMPLDCIDDSGGAAGVKHNDSDMVLRKHIQECAFVLLSLEHSREKFRTIRNRLSKITDRRKNLPSDYEHVCNVCCTEINPEDDKTFVKCTICQKYICRSLNCASWSSESSKWECELCKKSEESLAHTSSWVAEQISFHQETTMHPPRARSEIYIPISDYNGSSMHFESVSQVGANSAMITAEQKLKIREYVEETVAKILGGNLDTIAVNQLSKSENYLNLFYKYHSKLSNILINLETILTVYTLKRGDLPAPKVNQNAVDADNSNLSAASEARLRQMIQEIITETINLPLLSRNHAASDIAAPTNGRHQRLRAEKYFEPKIYQDLLATAVLNKIVDKQLNTKLDNELNPTKAGSVDIGGSGLDLENNLNIENFSTTSGSSVEPHSDCSDLEQILNADDDKPYIERNSAISEYLASHMVPLPDLTSVPTESEDDYMSVTSSAIGDGTWENNWLFRKKKFNSSSSVAVSSAGMLVPDPSEDIRAQIGDKTADEVSDLSELGSDTDDSLDIMRTKLEPINDRLANKHLIGGENDKIVLDELIKRSSMVSNTLPETPHESYTDTLNENVVDAPVMSEAINNNVNQCKTATDNDNCDTADGISHPLGSEDINSNSLTDQLSHDPNPYDNSRTTTVEDYTDSDNDQKEIHIPNIDNIFETSANTNTNTTSTTTFTEHIPNKSTNQIKTIKCKQAIDVNLSIASNTTNNSHDHLLLLTSAAQNNDASVTYSQSARGFDSSCNEHRIASDKTYINNGDGDSGNSGNDDDDDDDDSDDLAILRHFVPGSIAEREYKKWYNAVEMPNNPYAPEALKRRISGSQERFIDLPNISPIKEFNNLQPMKTETLDSDEIQKREIDHKRYSRDYYINSTSTSSQSTPVKERYEEKDTKEATNRALSYNEADFTLHKAMPAQVLENSSLTTVHSKTVQSSEVETIATTASEESTTIKMDNSAETSQNDKIETKPDIIPNKAEYCSNTSMPMRGSTPTAFKFLQPKRRLLEPSQILSTDENEENIVTTTQEKPVIEEEVAKALPSVKALARAFLMTTNTTQPEKLWLRKARTVSQSSKKKAIPTRSLDPHLNLEEDVTITSDLSSLETDSASIQKEPDLTNPSNTTTSAATSDINPLPVRQGVLKSNIAFFENLKNK